MYFDYGGLEPEIEGSNRRHHDDRCDDNACDLLYASSLWELGVMPNPCSAVTTGQPKLLLDVEPCFWFRGIFFGHAYIIIGYLSRRVLCQ
jgi:hypothetical protein